MGTLATASTGIIIAITSSWFTVQLSLRRFQKEKIWERKFEAYIKIIEALHHVKDYMADEESFELGIRNRENVSDETLSREYARYRAANEDVSKYRNIGELIISQDALLQLTEYFKNSSVDASHYMEKIDSIWNAADSCLNKLVAIAKKDLDESSNSYLVTMFFSKMHYLKKYLNRDKRYAN